MKDFYDVYFSDDGTVKDRLAVDILDDIEFHANQLLLAAATLCSDDFSDVDKAIMSGFVLDDCGDNALKTVKLLKELLVVNDLSIKTINVVEVDGYATPVIKSFPDTEDGTKAAQDYFTDCLISEGVSMALVMDYIDCGDYNSKEYRISLIRSAE